MSQAAFGNSAPPPAPENPSSVSQLKHPLERILRRRTTRLLLGVLTRARPGKWSLMERLFRYYDNPEIPLSARLRWKLPSSAIDIALHRAKLDKETMKQRLFHHVPTVKALVVTARSIARYGLETPQRFDSPLMVVWNITQACNLRCRHCYQNAKVKPLPTELSREEKLNLIDEMGKLPVPFLAIAGGEPLVCRDIWAVLERCREREIHTIVATNGTLLKPQIVSRLIDCGVKYTEVSIDSLDPHEHDRFRGRPGAWAQAIEGIQNSIAAGMRTGMAMCFTRHNADTAEQAIDFAIKLGCRTFSHFNFIPVGRGIEMAREDMTPYQRETLLKALTRRLQEGEINVISTAPQLGRACSQYGLHGNLFPAGHAGTGPGKVTVVLSRYIGGCGAARCYCALQPDGRITACVYLSSTVLGNVREKRLIDLWRGPLGVTLSRRDRFRDGCGSCDYGIYCGGCRARALAYTGDLLAGDPGCARNAMQWEELNRNSNLCRILIREQTQDKEPRTLNLER